MDLWGLPTLKEEKKEASGISAESLENMSSEELLEAYKKLESKLFDWNVTNHRLRRWSCKLG